MGPNKLGRYDIVRVLGKGAMGMVYEARDPNLDRRVAIKTIKVENLSPEASREYEARFRTEARSAARLQHPNIVSVYDSGRDGDVAYLVMEFVEGQDLKQHLDIGRNFTLQETLRMMRDLLAALDYAHRQSVVHRDVKPANLLLEASGRVKLTDFGVARIQDSSEATRTKGSMVGTLKYMSPEQVRGLPVDSRADLFSAGIVLYQLLTGNRPFSGDTDFAIIQQIVDVMPPAPSSVNADLPAALDVVVARALAKSRDDRFADADGFAQALLQATRDVRDLTIVPPSSVGAGEPGAGMGSGAQGAGSAGSSARPAARGENAGPSVSQELELIYWKDIRESDVQQELQEFLDHFPSGIYANLARRRMRKLREGSVGEQSNTQAMTVVQPLPARGDGGDATVELPHEATQVITRPDVGAAMPAVPAVDAASHGQPSGQPSSDPQVQLAPSSTATQYAGKRWLVFGSAVAAAAMVAAAVFWSAGPGPVASPAAGTVSDAADVPTAIDQAASPVPAPMASTALFSAAPLLTAQPASAGMPDKAASGAAKATAIAPKRDPGAIATSATAAPPLPPSPKPSVAPTFSAATASAAVEAGRPQVAKPADRPRSEADKSAAGSAAAGPELACQSRMLIGYQICMSEQCGKPQWSGHSICVQRAQAEKAAKDVRSERN